MAAQHAACAVFVQRMFHDLAERAKNSTAFAPRIAVMEQPALLKDFLMRRTAFCS